MGADDVGKRALAGRYEWVTLIGRGGMGEVWQSRDILLDRDVAVKKLAYPPDVDASGSVNRTMREARLAARLNHPNAVSIYDVVLEDGEPYLVMELVRGKALNAVIAERGRIDPMTVARLGKQIAAALAAAHKSGIIHRDVKPANVLITDDGTAKLTDFGIAHDDFDGGITSTGQFIGTPNFLAPEVALGEEHKSASDVWALGTVLYNAVEGRPPFGSDGNALAVLNRVATTDPPYPAHAGVLIGVITAAMRKKASERPNAETLSRLLEDIVAGRPGASMPMPLLGLNAPPTSFTKPQPVQGTPPPHLGTPPPPMGTPAPPPMRTPPPMGPPSYPSLPRSDYSGPPPMQMHSAPRPYAIYGPPTATAPPQHARKSRGPLIAAALVALAAVSALVVILATSGGDPQASPTPTTSPRTTTEPKFPSTSPDESPSTDDSPTDTGSSSPNDPHAACGDRSSASAVATSYAVALLINQEASAKACTDGGVPDDTTKELFGKLLIPSPTESPDENGDTVVITMTDLSDLEVLVTCVKQDDDKFLITSVDIQ